MANMHPETESFGKYAASVELGLSLKLLAQVFSGDELAQLQREFRETLSNWDKDRIYYDFVVAIGQKPI